MILARIYLGHEIKESLRHYAGEIVDIGRAAEIVADMFPAGYSQFSGLGRWRGPDGRAVAESSTVFEVLTDDPDKVYAVAESLKSEFRQDSVMVVVLPVQSFTF